MNETSALGGKGEVACTRARAAGVATIESAALARRDEEGKLASIRRCSSVRLAKRYFKVRNFLEGLEGPAAGASMSASLRFLCILADLTLAIDRAGSGVGELDMDGAEAI